MRLRKGVWLLVKLLIEGKDYYFNEQGLLVLTESYLRRRGVCCHNQCKHCPYTDCFCHKEKENTEK
ncbi:MAG: DUF5522 domain-containing protein [bacterium]|nr:DUF5522 domain-containing protein [bacterium]